MKQTLLIPLLALGGFLLATAPVRADDLAGESRFLCSATYVGGCAEGSCDDVSLEDVNLPQFVIVDLGAKLLSTTAASGENRSTPVEAIRREAGLITFQGLQNGRAFSFVIQEKTGRASVAIAREDLVLAVFAACTPAPAAK
jgi:hypothetical protein